MREFHRAPRGYELMVLINPEITDEALTAAIDAVSGYITTPGAEITYIKRDTPWGRRRLAYPIQRFRDATYVLFQFLASPSDLTDVERELKLDERIIRYLLVRQEHLHVPEDDEEATSEGGSASASGDEAAGAEPADDDASSSDDDAGSSENDAGSSDDEASDDDSDVDEESVDDEESSNEDDDASDEDDESEKSE